MSAVKTKPWHRDDLARLPNDGNRYEVLDGRLLVTPQASKPHQRVALEFAFALKAYVEPLAIAHVVGPAAVPFGASELQPDIEVLPGTDLMASWEDGPMPMLVIEVLSKSTRRRDLTDKRLAYLDRLGVQSVWIIDRWRRDVRVFDRGMPERVVRDVLEWQAPGAAAPLLIDLQALFTAALGAEAK